MAATTSPIWRSVAACRVLDPTLFYREPGDTIRTWRRKEQAAKAVCAVCPALRACREFAISGREFNEPDCVWGGLNDKELAGEARRRRRRAS